MSYTILFRTTNYKYLSDKVAKIARVKVGAVEVKEFFDGERYQRIISEIEGKK